MINKTNEKRRKVLKTAGVATVAAGAWQKPVLNSVITPAHAQTSMPAPTVVVGAGASSSTPPIVMLNRKSNNTIADRALDAVIPPAHAGVEVGGVVNECSALITNDEDDNTHCVSLSFPNGEDRAGEVTVSVNGPVIYYRPQCRYYDSASSQYYYSYGGSFQINDSVTVMMDDGDFEVTLDGVTVFGSVDNEFENASGTLIYTGPSENIGGLADGYTASYYCQGFDGEYGAYWAAELGTGSTCVVGMGAEGNGNNIVVNEDFPNECRL